MKFTNLLAFVVLFSTVLLFSACESENSASQETKDFSYAYGAAIGKQLNSIPFKAPLTEEEKKFDSFIKGFKKGLEGDSAMIMSAMENIQQRGMSPEPSASPEEAQKVAHDIGVSILGGLSMNLDIDPSSFHYPSIREGYETRLAGEELKFSTAEMDTLMKNFFEPLQKEYQTKMQAKQQAQQQQQQANAGKYIEEGRQFLAENAQKEGIVTTESGLQYEVIAEGDGMKPTINDNVKVNYHGTLIDGTVFDSSIERGQPASFPVNGVIKGWQEGIPLMSTGAKYKFYIPHNLAYGMQSPSPKIPPGATLIFDVELLEVLPNKPKTNN